MPEFKEHAPGTFSYAELASADPETTGKFYTELFGWARTDQDMGEYGVYTQFHLGGAITAAQYKLPADQQAAGVPAYWGQYVTVEDVAASAEKARQLGAEVVMGPMDVMEHGRMAVLKDPQGAVINLWQPLSHCGVGLLDDPGAMCWNELMTPDTDGAGKFYTNLFGWSTETLDMGEMGVYTMWTRGEGRPGGGMMAIKPEMGPIPPHWLLYFAVPDTNAAHARALELGGKSLVAPTDIPTAGRFAVLQDPVGAVFAIYKSQK
jgi:predicted enzyme related to lactoylglutathione lyase